ncbi:MAG: putative peptidoglycan lipid II flippase MurJ [Candidatus Gottesmanbacteria bacterium GW2011_GWA2_41_12]|uniref:Probable lipid II flippase MurJ n=1 Tax=Candidatus Gottesmanbacteria bacterium GW2011_GWA2_41_12 TaxID=1618440 RepID=A0A0G0XL14_9BACT|nr:MAG: putative peptidoglycan lipid II flippase MurJ [Candidatus Gottesmanbacteria bacterium GW2011_GWA2_41_12]
MVKLVLKNTLSIFTRQETGILSAAFVIMITVATSRVLGLVRDRMLAARFSADDLGIYFAAFRLPNLVFELLVMGALGAAFIPVFTTYISEDKREEAFKIASSVINIGLFIFAILGVSVLLWAKEISRILAPGFNEQQLALMATFTQIMVLVQVFPLVIGNFFTGILQSFKNFVIPSLAPVVYNLGIIAGIFFFTPVWGLYAPVLGVCIGAVLFMLIQIPTVLGFGYKHRFSLNLNNPGVKEVGRLMLPRTFGLAVSQIDTSVDLILSTLLGARSVTIFNFAQHLQQVPIGLFGASIAQASLPMLSSVRAKGDLDDFKKIFLASFHQILFLVLPFSVILIVLRIPAVRLVFGAERFDWEATVLTGKTLAYFSLSIFAQALVQLLARGFYAVHDSKTPVLISIFSVLINTILSIYFIQVVGWPVWSLGLSTSVASILNAFLLLVFLDLRIGGFDKMGLIIPTVKIFFSAIATGFFLYIPMKLMDKLVFDTTRTLNLIFLTGIATLIGLSVYIFLAWFLEIEEISNLKLIVKGIKKIKGVFIESTPEVINT